MTKKFTIMQRSSFCQISTFQYIHCGYSLWHFYLALISFENHGTWLNKKICLKSILGIFVVIEKLAFASLKHATSCLLLNFAPKYAKYAKYANTAKYWNILINYLLNLFKVLCAIQKNLWKAHFWMWILSGYFKSCILQINLANNYMLKVSSKDTRTTLLLSLWCLYC